MFSDVSDGDFIASQGWMGIVLHACLNSDFL